MKAITKSTLVLIAISLSGCATLDAIESDNDVARLLSAEAETTAEEGKYNKVFTLDRPPMRVAQLVEESEPAWLQDSVNIVADQFPLNLVLKDVLGNHLRIEYGFDVDPMVPVSIYHEGTKKEALNILSVAANYGIDKTEDGISVQKDVVRTFFLPAVSGDMSYQMGSQGGGAGQADAALSGNVASTGGDDGQYASISASGYNPIEHVKQGVEAIIKGVDDTGKDVIYGYVQTSPMFNSLVVKTNPKLMAQVERYIDSTVKELEREAFLEVAVIEYVAEGSSEIGADIAAAVSSGNFAGGISSLSPSLGTSLYGEGITVGLDDGAGAGTSALLKYLSKSGQVAVRTTQKVKASNFTVQEIDTSETQEYVSETEVSYSSENAMYPTTSISKDVVRDGVKMFAAVTIKEDEIYLRLTGVLSKLLRFEDVDIEGVTIKSPTVRQAKINTTGRYSFNESIIVAHMRQESTSTAENRTADITSGKSSSNKTIDTLVVVTPRRPLGQF